MKYIIHFFVVILSFTFWQCSSSIKNKASTKKQVLSPLSEGYSLIFYKLDDFAKVYLGDSLILDTSIAYGMAPKHDVLVELNLASTKDLTIEAHNAACTDCNSNKWQIIYEIFLDGESIDYVSEDSNGQPADLGLMTTLGHELARP